MIVFFQRKETSSDDEELYEVGDKSDSIDYVGMTSQQREVNKKQQQSTI